MTTADGRPTASATFAPPARNTTSGRAASGSGSSASRCPRYLQAVRLAVALVLALATVLAPVGALAATGSVVIASSGFAPSAITVTAGESVTWTNADTVNHTVIASNGSFRSGVIKPGRTFSASFPTAGSFPYSDRLSSFTGIVVVLPAPATPTPRPTPAPTPRPTPTATARPATTPRPTAIAPAPVVTTPPAEPPTAAPTPAATPAPTAPTSAASTPSASPVPAASAVTSGLGPLGPLLLVMGLGVALLVGLSYVIRMRGVAAVAPTPVATVPATIVREGRVAESLEAPVGPTYVLDSDVDEDAPLAVERGEALGPTDVEAAETPSTPDQPSLPPPEWLKRRRRG